MCDQESDVYPIHSCLQAAVVYVDYTRKNSLAQLMFSTRHTSWAFCQLIQTSGSTKYPQVAFCTEYPPNARAYKRHANPSVPADDLAVHIPITQHCEEEGQRVCDWYSKGEL